MDIFTTLAAKTPGILMKEVGDTDCKNQRGSKIFCMCFWDCPCKWRSHTHKVSSTWLPTHELIKNNRNACAKVRGGRTRGLNAIQKYYRQLKNWQSGRNNLPWRRTHHLVIHYKTVSPENMQSSNNIQTEKIIYWEYIYTCVYVCVCVRVLVHVCVCKYIFHFSISGPWRPVKGIKSPEVRTIGSCKLSDLNLGSPEKQQVFLTAKPSLQPHKNVLWQVFGNSSLLNQLLPLKANFQIF